MNPEDIMGNFKEQLEKELDKKREDLTEKIAEHEKRIDKLERKIGELEDG